MKLLLEDILERGYFLKELPPPFNTEGFSRVGKSILSKINPDLKKRFPSSECVQYSIPKNEFGRRTLGIPNPLHYLILCDSLVTNWEKIRKIYKASPYSTSRPLIDGDKLASHDTKNFEKFKRNRLILSADNIYELKTDISRYYSTIYTHIIPWAIYNRPFAKINRNNRALWGNILDTNIRNVQSQQTMGIPTGPEASAIIAEIIGCKLDKILKKLLPKVKGFRYIDDYYFYFPTEASAEKVIKNLQFVFGQYQLELNEGKTRVTKFPFELEPEWVLAMRSFKFRGSASDQEYNIRDFFSMVFRYAAQYPKESVFKYALEKIKTWEIRKENWPYIEAWLLKTAIHQPLTLKDIVEVLLINKKQISVTRIKATTEQLIKIHSNKRNSFELCWALWLAKSFKFKIHASLIKKVFNSQDTLATLIALDLRDSKLVNGYVSIRELNRELTEDSLFNERWLLSYEAIMKKWLKPADTNILKKNQFFKNLVQSKISFYDGERQLKIKERQTKNANILSLPPSDLLGI